MTETTVKGTKRNTFKFLLALPDGPVGILDSLAIVIMELGSEPLIAHNLCAVVLEHPSVQPSLPILAVQASPSSRCG